jgi:molybdenum cofactor synthesis domain-containing protein
MKIRAVVLTISDSAARGEREDLSGPALIEELQRLGAEIIAAEVLPDDRPMIARRLLDYAERADVNLILTTGGTGLSPRDHTPEATRDVIEREVPGIPEAIRLKGVLESTPFAMLSRGVAGIRAGTLIINLPGSVRGAREGFAAIRSVLRHAVETLSGETAHGDEPTRRDIMNVGTSPEGERS